MRRDSPGLGAWPSRRPHSGRRPALGRRATHAWPGTVTPRRRPRTQPLARAGAAEQRREGLRADGEVDDEAAMAEVPEVVRELVAGARRVGRVAAPDLRPAGDPGLDHVTAAPERHLRLELGDELRPLRTRADDRHLALQHVRGLGQLVEPRLAEPAPELRPARIER